MCLWVIELKSAVKAWCLRWLRFLSAAFALSFRVVFEESLSLSPHRHPGVTFLRRENVTMVNSGFLCRMVQLVAWLSVAAANEFRLV